MADSPARHVDTDRLYVALQEMIDDHRNRRDPWTDLVPPEQLVLDEIHGLEARLRFLTFGCALDYARDADVHWRSMDGVRQHLNWAFDPCTVARSSPALLELSFSSEGVRFWGVDAGTWHTIACSLTEHFDGMVFNLVESADFDAPTILEALRSGDAGDYPYLGGDKIAPMYLRMIDEYCVQLDRIGMVDLPVDVQVEKVTVALTPDAFGDEPEDERLDVIREFWTDLSDRHGLPLYRVDELLWQLGRHWDDWGREYFTSHLTNADVDCPLTTTLPQ